MAGHLSWIDWLIVALYVAFALGVGFKLARKAEEDVDQFFLSGRTLPWWMAGTSIVATSFAVDTPLLISGMVRDLGIWSNWLWWCYAISGVLGVFLFSRYWRRGGLMTKAELAELRYGGREAAVLRGTLGVMHAGMTNTLALCWVLLAASKVMDVVLDVDKAWALVIACAIAMTYTLLAGFWGVVLTDLLQFVLAMTGSIALAAITWNAVGGGEAIQAAAIAGTALSEDTLRFLPSSGPGGPLDASFWTTPLSMFAIYVGLYWWGAENVDGSGISVQRILASKDDRHGMLAVLWYNVAHYALRPWPWIAVGLASLLVFPEVEVRAPHGGVVESVSGGTIVLAGDGGTTSELALAPDASLGGWGALPRVAAGGEVLAGDLLARSDPERAYVWMMVRYLPVGLLGLMVASLLAAFMSTVDTHVNLASSFFVNDVYRRFLAKDRGPTHYVRVAQAAGLAVMAAGALMAYQADSIVALFKFFVAFLGGVGPIYVMRWLWWRVRVSTEITAMIASSVATTGITLLRGHVALPEGPLTPSGLLLDEGRQVAVVLISLACALIAIAVARRPDPASLVGFYRRVRPMGWWGPVRALAPDVDRPREGAAIAVGAISGLLAIYAPLFGVGWWLLGRRSEAALAALVLVTGCLGVRWALARVSVTRSS